jgi:hypothetical protein
MRIITIMLCMFTTYALADTQPSYLKDATISVTLKNGKVYMFNANDYKVVKREDTKCKPVVCAECPASAAINKPSVVAASVPRINRIRVMGGVGPSGIKSEDTGSMLKVSPSYNAVGGVGYDRMLNDKLSINGQAYTNGTFSLGVGFDF